MGVAERLVWSHIRGKALGFHFRRQYPIGPYILDFYCARARLCVEIDGPMHDENRDSVRDAFLKTLGIETLRIPTADIYEDASVDFVKIICMACEARISR